MNDSSKSRRLMKGVGAAVSLGSLVLMSSAVWATAAPTTLYVSPTGSNTTGTGQIASPYRTIQHAVSASVSGDTIVVEPGTYSGTVSITDSITLESEPGPAGGPANTILNVSGDLLGIEVSGAAAAGTTISGLTITNPNSHAILVLDTSHVSVLDNVISNTGLGLNPAIPENKAIILTGTSSSTVMGNTLTNVIGGGISVTDDGALNPALAQPASGVALPANDNLIADNTISGATHACGIVVAAYNSGGGVNGNQIVGNTVTHNVAGIVVATNVPNSSANANVVADNTSTNNFLPGVIVHSNAPGDQLTNTVVTGNTISGDGTDPEVGALLPTGIVVAGVVNPVMGTVVASNLISQEHYGIFLTGALGSHLYGNTNSATVPIAPGMELVGPTSVASAGQTLTYTAAAPVVSAPEYQFWVDSAAHGWQLAQNYSSNPTLTLPSVAAGSYVIAAYAMTGAQVAAGDWQAAQEVVQAVNVDSGVSLSVTGGAMTSGPGMAATAHASATNLLHPVYQFWVENPAGQWSQSGAYSSSSTFTLPMNSGTTAGTYKVVAFARDASAPETAAAEVMSQVVSVTQNPAVMFQVTPATSTVAAGQSDALTLTQDFMNGTTATASYLDNLDATITVKTASGSLVSGGFSVSGLGTTSPHALVSGQYTFLGAPTSASGTVTLSVGASVPAGTYTVTFSDPDHMVQSSNTATITVGA